MINLGFIGVGNMGMAIMEGIKNSEIADNIKLFATDTDIKKLVSAKEQGVIVSSNAKELVQKCKYVILATKPQVFDIVLEDISEVIDEDTVLVSIAAGITGEYIKSKTISNAKVVLVMPNTPLLLGEGATALAKIEPTTKDEFEFICNIFKASGEIAILPKEKMKEVIALNGSSPAFIYLFAKGFIEYAKDVGIPKETAKILFAQSLIGSARMITESGDEIDELIEKVSSPGGTTLAGLDRLYEGKLVDTIKNACESCTNRAYELSK
ncbi:MAG: pyrroline-5-carboxylate reductase [Clostridiales bacterium]|nr:pyrroline-5-carboxylate reductase [Clostridiales bacterium]